MRSEQVAEFHLRRSKEFLDAFDGNTHGSRDLLVRHLVTPPKDEGDSSPRRQLIDRHTNGAGYLVRLEAPIGCPGRGVRVEGRIDSNTLGPFSRDASVAQMLERAVSCGREEVGANRAWRGNAITVHPNRHEEILHNLLGDLLREYIRVDDLAQRSVQRPKELLEGCDVTPADARSEWDERVFGARIGHGQSYGRNRRSAQPP
jgi:hypothetical protein